MEEEEADPGGIYDYVISNVGEEVEITTEDVENYPTDIEQLVDQIADVPPVLERAEHSVEFYQSSDEEEDGSAQQDHQIQILGTDTKAVKEQYTEDEKIEIHNADGKAFHQIDRCAICLEHQERVAFLMPCVQGFCHDCGKEWSLGHRSNCPECRVEVEGIIHSVVDDYVFQEQKITKKERVVEFSYESTNWPPGYGPRGELPGTWEDVDVSRDLSSSVRPSRRTLSPIRAVRSRSGRSEVRLPRTHRQYGHSSFLARNFIQSSQYLFSRALAPQQPRFSGSGGASAFYIPSQRNMQVTSPAQPTSGSSIDNFHSDDDDPLLSSSTVPEPESTERGFPRSPSVDSVGQLDVQSFTEAMIRQVNREERDRRSPSVEIVFEE